MSLGLIYKNAAHIFDEVEKKTPYLEYPLFQETGIVTSAFSTRLGGVSEGYYSSLNLSFDRGDDPARVLENFKRIGASMGVAVEDMVLSKQTHTTNVRVVTEEDKGKGVMRERNYTDVDGMITNVPGICLVTSYADCVPLYFVDPVKKAIGLSHSGWRGTVGKIGKNTVQLMQENFGSKPKDLLAAVGPSVCMDCYEVSEDVIEQFKEAFEKKYWEDLFYGLNQHRTLCCRCCYSDYLQVQNIHPHQVLMVLLQCLDSPLFHSHNVHPDASHQYKPFRIKSVLSLPAAR